MNHGEVSLATFSGDLAGSTETPRWHHSVGNLLFVVGLEKTQPKVLQRVTQL